MKSNYRQIEKVIDFAKEFKFDCIQLSPILGITGTENIFLNQDNVAGEYLTEILPKIIKRLKIMILFP